MAGSHILDRLLQPNIDVELHLLSTGIYQNLDCTTVVGFISPSTPAVMFATIVMVGRPQLTCEFNLFGWFGSH